MAFRFTSSSYHFPDRWSVAEKKHATQILTMGTKYGSRPADIMKMFVKAGISYRKTNMLEDIGRSQATEQSKTVGAYNRASSWFDTMERVRAENPGWTRTQASGYMERWKTESWESAEEALAANKLEVQGECPSPSS